MKKILCILLTSILLWAIAAGAVMAVNDAADLSYRLQLEVTDEGGVASNVFKIGDRICIKLSLIYTGTGKAPVHGLQGRFRFDPYVIQCMSIKEKNNISAKDMDGHVAFVYLDMTGQGKNDSMLSNLGEIEFVAKNNGTVDLYADDFIITNRDASARYIDDSEMVTLVIGTGVKDVTKELLQNDIAAAEKMLAGCTITDQSNPQIYYPDFWITTKTEKTFKDAIEFAIAIYQKANATPEEIETAITDLAIAVKVFENAKIIGPRRWSDDDYSGSDSSSGVSSAVTVNASVKAGNGKIHPDFVIQKCRINTSCSIRVIPDEGYETEYIYVNGERFAGSDLFTIPNVERDTTVSVVFCRTPPFTDITPKDWFYVSVRYAWNNELFKGTSDTEFSPSLNMTRAMLATVLYRMDGQPEVNSSSAFVDVKEGMWYTDAVAWANESAIVKGYGNGIFAPDDMITREQIAVMLHRYAQGKGLIANESTYRLNFSDTSHISDFAFEAMTWAVENGLIQGNTSTTVNPLGKATRAEVAAILMRYKMWQEDGSQDR